MRYNQFEHFTVMEAGRQAYLKGNGLEVCPYRPYSLGEDVWMEGWREAWDKSLTESNGLYEDEEYDDPEDFYLRYGWFPETLEEAVYNGRKVQLNKVMTGDKKRNKVYVNCGNKNADGEIVAKKIEFGSKKGSDLRVRKDNEKARKSFAARHNCDTAKDKCTARYWSCRAPQSKEGGTW